MRLTTKHFNQTAVRTIISARDLSPLLLEIYAAVSAGELENHPKFSLPIAASSTCLSFFNSMPAYLPRKRYAGIKWVSVKSENAQLNLPTVMGTIILNDPETGYPLAIMDGTWLSSWRTGVTAGMCAEYFSPTDSQVMTVIGPGANSAHALNYLLPKLPALQKVNVIGRTPVRTESFIEQFATPFPDTAFTQTDIATACAESDIVLVSTNAREPLLNGISFKAGACIVGANGFLDLGTDILEQVDLLVFDQRTTAMKRLQELSGVDLANRVNTELGEAVNRGYRHDKTRRVLAVPAGMAVIDLALAAHVYENASEGVLFDYQA
ncbi:ornithine cyclodeaminase family protein [Pseudomonas resinovorans]|uniref:Ornithine cyclodeaminase family protein n=1 Tax=Metapseudomonas resinovorans TaxID=53412 RepID=A0ABT4YC86_METRE|nr:ornithine cyclodeaminase family protein [Pseudomonas resinovorans]MDA8486507.1 ornithine cyclodeaminase family protein [Pseudomonas resinovorans]